MHIFIHLLILFIFVFALLMLNIPQIEHDSYIKMKLYIFSSIFLFEMLISIFITIYNKCIVNIGKIARQSLQSALVATVAYSIYNDMVLMSSSLLPDQENVPANNLMITVIITAFVAFNYFIEIIFSNTIPNVNDCLNTIYPGKKN
jgi:hypothetical protein